jgi:RNA polymerase sigma factor (sigma-70 family)
MATQTYLRAAHDVGQCTNTSLLERARNGDQLAWRCLLDKYDGLVRSVARSFRLQAADVSDVSQTTWLRLLQYSHKIVDPERLAGWLAVTATRECLAVIRKRSRLDDDQLSEEMPDPRVDVELSVTDHETATTLWAAVADLPSRQRILIRSLFLEELGSYADVAAKCAMPVGSIGPTRARALSRLQQKLAERGMGSGEL